MGLGPTETACVIFCPRRLLCGWRLWYTACRGEAYRALYGEAVRCFCPRKSYTRFCKGG